MPADHRTNAFAALTRRRYLLSAWPWRSLLFVASSVPVIGLVAILLSPFSASWAGALAAASHGRMPTVPVGILLVLGTAYAAIVGPLLAIPIAALERRRLGTADPRPIASSHRRPRPGRHRT